MLAPNPAAATTWPIAGDVPDLLAIVTAQAETIADQNALVQAYQEVLSAAQGGAPGTPATANGQPVSNTASLPVVGTTGAAIVTGAVVEGTPNTIDPVVLGQISGTVGGDGTYLLSAPVTLTAVTALTFVPPPGPATWPTPQDPDTLNLITQQQTAILRTQNALIQHYQDLLNTSETPPPPTGP